MITQTISTKCPNLISLARNNKKIIAYDDKAPSKSYIYYVTLKKKKK